MPYEQPYRIIKSKRKITCSRIMLWKACSRGSGVSSCVLIYILLSFKIIIIANNNDDDNNDEYYNKNEQNNNFIKYKSFFECNKSNRNNAKINKSMRQSFFYKYKNTFILSFIRLSKEKLESKQSWSEDPPMLFISCFTTIFHAFHYYSIIILLLIIFQIHVKTYVSVFVSAAKKRNK